MYPNWTLYFSDVNTCASFYCFISFETNVLCIIQQSSMNKSTCLYLLLYIETVAVFSHRCSTNTALYTQTLGEMRVKLER
ncbi:hypothetical protein F2P79_008023 [Pimephales promelas]|nr:hypothetical protein F2P79_008023 [Pimephales promelas]